MEPNITTIMQQKKQLQ